MTQPRVRVLLCTPLPPPYGGVATWSTEILQSTLSREFDIRVTDIAPRSDGDQRSRFRLTRAVESLGVFGKFVQQLSQFKPHVVHCSTSFRWGLARDLPMALVAKAAGAKVILHTHGGDFHVFLDRLAKPLALIVLESLRRLDCVVVLTDQVKNALEGRFGLKNVVKISNFIDIERFDANKKKIFHEYNPNKPLDAVFIGWLIEAKGIFDLIRVLASVPGWNITFVGPSPNDQTVHRLFGLAHELNVLPRVMVRSAVPVANIPAILNEADFFVLPSHREGFPISILEAMAAGVPVVATDVGAVSEIVKNEITGILVPSGNQDKLADSIHRIVTDPELRSKIAENAKELVRSKYDVTLVAAAIGALWTKLSENP